MMKTLVVGGLYLCCGNLKRFKILQYASLVIVLLTRLRSDLHPFCTVKGRNVSTYAMKKLTDNNFI